MASFPLFYDFVSWRRKLCNYKMKVVNVSESTYLPIQFAKSFLRIISICGLAGTVNIADGSDDVIKFLLNISLSRMLGWSRYQET